MLCTQWKLCSLYSLLYVHLLVAKAEKTPSGWPDGTTGNHRLRRRGDCDTNPDWQSSQYAWTMAKVDDNLEKWWSNVTKMENTTFTNELARHFGDKRNTFNCGIKDYSTCISAGCADFQNNNDPIWAYLSIQAIINLNTAFNTIYDGITNGQLGYLGLVDDMAHLFFPWNDPPFVIDDILFWVTAVIIAILAGVTGVGEAAGFAGLTAFIAAGTQQASASLMPSPHDLELKGLALLRFAGTKFGEQSRQDIESWANNTFAGRPDKSNKTIVDYLRNGSYISASQLPTSREIESYYKKSLISRSINKQWRQKKNFIIFASTNDSAIATGPEETKYYSPEKGGVYYLYSYHEDGILRGHLDKPIGMQNLNRSEYLIQPWEVTKASARAWEHSGFNYSDQTAKDRIQDAFSSNGTLTPFKDGAGWEGTWTIPVCDVGTHTNWNARYGPPDNKTNSDKSRYDMLPCCCGPNCTDTKAFVEAANLWGLQTLLYGCRVQLKNSGIRFEDVDYGYNINGKFPLRWQTWSDGQRAALVIGIMAPVLLLYYSCTRQDDRAMERRKARAQLHGK